MKRKALLLFGAYCMLQLMIAACTCTDPPPDIQYDIEHITVNNIDNSVYETGQAFADTVVVHQRNHLIHIETILESVANTFDWSRFTNKAYANSCHLPGEVINQSITNVTISANESILDTEAGNPLSKDHFRIIYFNFNASGGMSIEEWLHSLNNTSNDHDPLFRKDIAIVIKTPIQYSEFLKFTLAFELNNGQTIVSETNFVKLTQ